MTPPLRRAIQDSLRAMLAEGTGKLVGVLRAPEGVSTETDQLRLSYAIIYPLPAVEFDGPGFEDPEAIATFPYQVTSFGWRDDQVQDMDDLVRELWLARDPNGKFSHPLDADGIDELDRSVFEAGGTVPTDGTRLAVQSTLLLKASRT